MPQDRLLELPQGRGRLDPELGDERLPRRAVDLERLRLSAGSVERLHQRAREALVERMLVDERLQLRDELGVAAEREVGLDSQLERGQTCSLEALDLRVRGRVVGEIRERLAAPEVERLAQETARPGGLRRFCLGDQPLEAEQVELIRVDPDQVPRLLREDRPRRRRAACAAARRGTEARSPRRPAGRVGHSASIRRSTDTARLGVSRRAVSSARCFGPAERNRAAAVDDFERPQDPKLHRSPPDATMTSAGALREGSAGLSIRVHSLGARRTLAMAKQWTFTRPSTSAPTSSATGSRS